MEGLTLSPAHVARLNRMLSWYERSPHNASGELSAVPVLLPFEFRRFELKYALTPGGYATAYSLFWDDTAGDYVVKTDAAFEFEVYDPHGLFRGRAKDAYSSPHNAGSRGLAWNPHDCPRWEVVFLQPHALALRGSAVGAVSGATFTIDGVQVMQPIGGLITTSDPAAAITVYNVHTWTADDNAIVYAVWNESTAHWEAEQIDCPA